MKVMMDISEVSFQVGRGFEPHRNKERESASRHGRVDEPVLA